MGPVKEQSYPATHREYAGAIWEIQAEGIPVIQARIAEWLGVSRASVSENVRKLEAEGLIEVGADIRLTEAGRHLAEVIVRRHRLTERFLTDVLGLTWDKVHPEAEVWETMISDDVEAAMWKVLDRPTTCPHGNPIPGSGYSPPPMVPLADVADGAARPIERLSEELEMDDEMMGFLDRSGLRPGTQVEVLDRSPQGALTVRIGGGEPIGISHYLAERVFLVA